MKNDNKKLWATGLGAFFFFISKAFAQTNAAPLLGGTAPDPGNFFVAFLMQAFYNPSSFGAIGLLGVVAWCCDDFDFIQAKYVKHITVLTGVCTYWAFTDPDKVAQISKHPISIYLSYGAMCGAMAYVGHIQIINRLRDFFAAKKLAQQNP